jgi:hypothetical protein
MRGRRVIAGVWRSERGESLGHTIPEIAEHRIPCFCVSYSLFLRFVFPVPKIRIPCSTISNSLFLQTEFWLKMAEFRASWAIWPESDLPKNTKFPVNCR